MSARRPPPGVARTARARRRVLPLVAVAIVSLLLGLWAGLVRIGWELPPPDGDLAARHGGVMVVGFVATVIGVERAVAVGSRLALAAPLASALAGLALLAQAPMYVAIGLAFLSALAYTANLARLWRQQPQVGAAALVAGGACLAIGAAVWWILGGYSSVVPWWMAFLVLTISGERLELTRFRPLSSAERWAGVAAFALVVAGPALALGWPALGGRMLGAGMVATAVWSARRDTALRTLRAEGVPRFAAVGVLLAYLWLLVTGLLLLPSGLAAGTLRYDSAVHAFFTGFMFSAIVAHEPLIAPAISGRTFAFSRLLYVPLVALSLALVVRIGADLAGDFEVRRWAGLMQTVALLMLLGLTARAVLLGPREPASTFGGHASR